MCIAAAAADGDKPSVDETRFSEFEQDFAHTGERRNCIDTQRIRNARIIDNQHILFRLSHGEYVLNKLPKNCASLRARRSFAYAPISMRLCSVDTITVLDNIARYDLGGRFHGHGLRPKLPVGPRCGLGQFEVVTPRDS